MNVLEAFQRLKAYGPTQGPRGRFAWAGPAVGMILVAASAYVLWGIAREADYEQVKSAFTAATRPQLGLAAALTVVSYLLLTCYDAVALRQLGLRIPYSLTALGYFGSYALSFTLGYTLLAAGTVRYWIYARHGISVGKVVALTVIAGFTFTLGMGAVLAWSVIVEAEPLALLFNTNPTTNRLIGIAAAAAVLGYLAWVGWKRRVVSVRGWSFELPGLRLSLGQLLIGAADVCVAAGVLYVLLPAMPGLGYGTCLAIFIFAAMVGSVSHVPGGLGPFEATVLLALSNFPREPVLGSLLLFRLCYYIIPFLLALVLLAIYEFIGRRRPPGQRETGGDALRHR